MSNKLTRLAQEILAVESDLPFRWEWQRDKETRVDDFEFHIFPQTWGEHCAWLWWDGWTGYY